MAVLSTLPAVKRRIDAPVALRLWHLTSLDAPTVAFVWTLAFGWAAHIRLPLWLPVVVSLAAWTCYIADRLMDARKARRAAGFCEDGVLRERHHFHWRNRRFLLPVAFLAGGAALVLVLRFMPLHAQERDSALAIAAFAYFGSVHSPNRQRRTMVPKELLVAIVFTLACAAAAFTRSPSERLALLIPLVVFVAIAWLNCHAIEVWESSFLHSATEIRRWGYSLAALLLLMAVAELAVMRAPRMAALLVTASASAALLGLLDQFRERLSPLALRAAADLVLLTPVTLLFFA